MRPSSDSIPYRLLFIAPTLDGGGAERTLVNVVNHLDRSRFQPHLALFQTKGVLMEELAPDVTVNEIQPIDHGGLRRNWTRIRALGRLFARLRPALIMSILWQANAVAVLSAALWHFRAPIVINEQTAPRASLRTDPRRRWLWPIARRLYRRASHIVAISHGIAAELEGDLHIPASRMSVIHNPIAVAQIAELARHPIDFKVSQAPALIAAGRLVPLKNYPLLLRAVALVLQQQDVELYILGKGPESAAIEDLATALGISGHVHLLGFQPNPYPYIAQADLFALSSDHEGFGNVLVEAMSLGVPVVATDCPHGPREILDGGKYGLLVPTGDERALAEAILSLLRNPDRCRTLTANARDRAKDFSIEKIISSYEQLFLRLIERQAARHDVSSGHTPDSPNTKSNESNKLPTQA
jgi:glycosyltransferase involved in cell wall biosynthesis